MQEKKKQRPEDDLGDYTNRVISDKFLLQKGIGKGAHGMVYLGQNLETDKKIACKLMAKLKKHKLKFQRELAILRETSRNPKGGTGFPKLYGYD